jgi:acyl-CoA thioester hydrolase
MSNENRIHEVTIEVPFYDVDPMQIVWHGNYLKYFEVARSALLKKAGLDLFDFYQRTKIVFPVTKISTKHIYPLRYKDEIVCRVETIEAQYKIVLDFEIRLVNNGKLCTRGRTEQVAVKTPEMEIIFGIPDEIRNALGFQS